MIHEIGKFTITGMKDDSFSAPVSSYLNKEGASVWFVNFNTKIGDAIIFNYLPLAGLCGLTRNIVSPTYGVLNLQKFNLFPVMMDSIKWDENVLDDSVNKAFDMIEAPLMTARPGDLIFLDATSLTLSYLNYFSDRGESVLDLELFQMKALTKIRLLQLALKLKDLGTEYIFWRDPSLDPVWGKNNFSFLSSLHGDESFKTYLPDDDVEAHKIIDPDVNVYKISELVYQFVFGQSISRKYRSEDFTSITRSATKNKRKTLLVNLNTGSLMKKIALESCFSFFMESLLRTASELKLEELILTELEDSWNEAIKESYKVLVKNSGLTFRFLSQRNRHDWPAEMMEASLVFTHCSGFSHLAHIHNPNVLTFTLKDTVDFINGKNPWAPANSVSIDPLRIHEDMACLCHYF